MSDQRSRSGCVLRARNRAASILVAASFACLLPFAAGAADWSLLGWNNLGMHCMDADFAVFAILPPYNTIHAQLVAADGAFVDDPASAGITVTYEAIADPTGSINTTAAGKTNFWDHVQDLFGASPGVDVGLTGVRMPGAGNVPQPMTWDAAHRWFVAEGIPITPTDDAGHKNTYPLFRLTARGPGGVVLATADIVLPVSDEMDCRACHASGSGTAAEPTAGWVQDPDPQRDMRLNILRIHDERQAGDPAFGAALAANGFDPGGLFATATGGHAILCARCHLSEALPGSGLAGVPPLTRAVHMGHAAVLDPGSGIPLGSADSRQACYRCHPGSQTKCLRGVMGNAVSADGASRIQCQSCHGQMRDVGAIDRTGWLQEPLCQSCHTGTAVQNAGALRYLDAHGPDGQPRAAVDATFASNADTPGPGLSLYRFSAGHGGLECEGCHGSTHAEFPSSHANDNLFAIVFQGHSGTLVECDRCHGGQPDTVAGGPHGMHPVGQAWVSRHPDAAEGGGTGACRACHGTDYRGTELSRAHAARVLSSELGTIETWAGFQIGCYACHRGPSSEDRNPNRAATVNDASASTPQDVPASIPIAARDLDGNALVLRVVSQPANGIAGITGSTALYTPDAGFSGDDYFTVAAWDGSIDSNLATVHVTVGGGGPDVATLRGEWLKVKGRCRKIGTCRVNGVMRVTNVGDTASSPAPITWLLSTDVLLDPADVTLATGQVPALAPNASARLRLRTPALAGIAPVRGKHVLAVIAGVQQPVPSIGMRRR